MLSNVGLEVMNSTNPELNWKTVTKGRRSRKSIARSLNGVSKAGNPTSPKRVGDFSGSDSDKFGEAVLGQSTSGNSENVPIKKRRHLLRSPSPHPWTPPLRRQDSSSPRPRSSSLHSEGHGQLPYPCCSSGQRSLSSYSNWQLRGIDGSAKGRIGERFDNIFLCDRTEGGYNYAGDFSGIELLAAAASMDDDANNANKEDLVAEDSLMPKSSDTSSFATQPKLHLKCNESENSLIHMTGHGGNTDCSLDQNNAGSASPSLCGSPEDGTMPKVNRQHWDLNTPMDAWGEPYDDTIAGNTSKDVDDDMHMEERQKGAVAARETSDQATGKDADERNSNQVLSCDAHMETSNQVMNTDAIRQISPLTKLRVSSSMLMSEEKKNTMSGTVAIMQDEDCSSNVSGCDRTTASDGIQARTQDVTLHDMPSIEISESAIDVQHKDTKDSQKASEPPGNTISSKETINSVACERLDVDKSESNSDEVSCFYPPLKSVNFDTAGTFIQDGQSVLIAESQNRIDGTFVTGSTIDDCQQHLEQAELVTELEHNNLGNEGSKRIIMEDTCKSSCDGAQCDDPTNSVGKIGSNIDDQHDSDVSQNNHVHMVDGDDLTGFQDGYDSPYEDGELRGSFLCSWEDNELENECVDYESDLRNGDGSDAADYPGSEIVEEFEGGSEGSHGTERRNLSMKRSPEGHGSKTGSAKHSFGRHFIKDDSDNNEIAGKGESNAGSGTTVEQSIEMGIEEHDDGMKRRQLTERRDTVGVKVAQMDEYVSKMARGKLQSRIEGRSSMDATNGKDVFFIQQCRSHRLGGSYSRPERDISPDKYLGRYKSATHSERDGVDQWTYWGSRKRYTSSYQGAEGRSHTRPRSIIGDSAEKFGGLDFHDPRQTANYWSKGLHRPLTRRSPVDRDDCLGVRRRMPLTRGVSSYRSRGHYSQRAGRDFGEDFEPLPDDAATSGRLPRYLSRRERSFSPSSGRSAHMPLQPRRRSRSRSRTRSPRAWPAHRERNLGTRRNSRSPDFRFEARMERMRVPFPKPTFASNYGEGYISPSRGRFSPQRNCRWIDDRSFADNHLRRRRSPVRDFRRTQRFDTVGSSGRLRSDEYFRSMIRPGRFSFMAKGGREGKFESNYDDRRRDDSGEMMHRGLHSDDGGNVRRFRNNAADDFETSNLNNEDDVRGTDSKDVPQTQTDREDKRAFKI